MTKKDVSPEGIVVRESNKHDTRHQLDQDFIKKLQPLKPLDLKKCSTVNDLVTAYKDNAFGARSVGEAADVLTAMAQDPDCFVVATFSGAMTIAKMGLVICEMIEHGLIHAVVSTGALMAHGFVENVGMTHFKYNFDSTDEDLFHRGFDRVYDTLEVEKNLDDVSKIVEKLLGKVDAQDVLCSHKLNTMFGEYLHKNINGRGILKSAYENNIPVYVPAFTDSEMGLDVGVHNRWRKLQGKPLLVYNPLFDLDHYTELIRKQKRIGIFTIGGGVPRNWAQQVGPYLDIIRWRILEKEKNVSPAELETYFKRFHYAVRICPEPTHWGGLSGCTYSEGVSWGKFVPRWDGGKWAEVYADATIAWPLVVKAVLERLGNKPVKKNLPL